MSRVTTNCTSSKAAPPIYRYRFGGSVGVGQGDDTIQTCYIAIECVNPNEVMGGVKKHRFLLLSRETETSSEGFRRGGLGRPCRSQTQDTWSSFPGICESTSKETRRRAIALQRLLRPLGQRWLHNHRTSEDNLEGISPPPPPSNGVV
jgi:hypothetical protein